MTVIVTLMKVRTLVDTIISKLDDYQRKVNKFKLTNVFYDGNIVFNRKMAEEEDTILDNKWMQSFKDEEKVYQEFYKDDVWHINLRFVYVNVNNEVDCIREDIFLMSKSNRILEEELIQILKRSSNLNGQRYSLISILRYNVLLEPSEIKHYLSKMQPDSNYLCVVTHLKDIVFERTISMFQDLNDLIFVFYEKPKESNCSTTKRVYIRNRSRKKTLRNKIIN